MTTEEQIQMVERLLGTHSALERLELWHAVYDAALIVGCDASAAAERADERSWPADPSTWPSGYEWALKQCSPFREAAYTA